MVRYIYILAYGDFKDLPTRTTSGKVLRDKEFEIASNPKCDGYQSGLPSRVYKCFNKKAGDTSIQMGTRNSKN